jgi:hypothetical protein
LGDKIKNNAGLGMRHVREAGKVYSGFWLGDLREKKTLGRLRCREENNIRIGLQNN